MTKTKLNIESWNRKEHFRFFSAFDDPFFGITTNVDFTTIYLEAKHNSQSFFLYSLHHISVSYTHLTLPTNREV